MSRFFVLEIPHDQEQVRLALATQARIELNGSPEPPESLIAMQEYLQLLAPWNVVVPFAEVLADQIGQSKAAARVMRDFARLLTLIKCVCLIRHYRRATDGEGRLVATLDDYRYVYLLIGSMYAETLSGASEGVRKTVAAVSHLQTSGEKVTYARIATHLDVHHSNASRWAKTAERNGWLENRSKSRTADLAIGDPLPDSEGLPSPDHPSLIRASNDRHLHTPLPVWCRVRVPRQ